MIELKTVLGKKYKAHRGLQTKLTKSKLNVQPN